MFRERRIFLSGALPTVDIRANDADAAPARKTMNRNGPVEEKLAHYETLLGQEALALARRMRWLAHHPHVPVFLGGSSIKISYLSDREVISQKHDIVATPLLFTTKPDNLDETTTYDGFAFMTPARKQKTGYQTVSIAQYSISGQSEEQKQIGGYEITIDQNNKALPRAIVENGDFSYWAVGSMIYEMKQLIDFERRHPTLNPNSPDYEPDHASRELVEEYQGLNEKATYNRQPEFPEGVYYFPLGLVRQARKLLS
jgi:hypothetical protein